MKKRVLFLLLIFSSIMLCCNYNQPNTKEKPVKSRTRRSSDLSLGRGINIGNTFEADQSWQSPFVAEDLKKIADLGFTHVRVPIRWERADRSIDEVPYTINSDFLKTIQVVVDEALKNKLHVIINMHHHNNLMAEPDSNKARFILSGIRFLNISKITPIVFCLRCLTSHMINLLRSCGTNIQKVLSV